MYLKNLTVFGFKSFADKTSLNFQPGVTAIVGPNGCGKSNVSDSIRWVLGEQSAKALRGGEMADVIFNGTDSRKPMAMAEVSLTLGGVDAEHLKAAGVEVAYDEVTVTRRIYRDGGSEYFINRTSCRLRDIQQLFMGTGVGRSSYSILAQGHITQILSSKPEDRRMIFEEAAGITKFKSQKKESLRKLEATDQNLLRVADLIREVKRQIGSLQRQAGKARRYKQLALDLEHLETQLARHQYDVLQVAIGEKQAQAEQLRLEIESTAADVQKGEDEIGQLRTRLTELEHEVAALQQKGLELKSGIDRHASRIHFNEQRLQELESQNSKALADIAQAEERRATATADFESVTEGLANSESTLAGHREALEDKLESVRAVDGQLRQRQEELRQAQSAAFAAAQTLSRVRNEINTLDMQKQGNTIRLEKLASENVQLEEERARLEVRLLEFTATVEEEKLLAQTKRGSVEERQTRLRQLQTELQQSSQEQDKLLQKQAEKRSRLHVLEQLEGAHEGFSAGTQAALKQSKSVIGSLVDHIRVPDQYVVAIENALGHNLQLVLTEQPAAAQDILAGLTANKSGRASIAALTLNLPEELPVTLPAPADGATPTPEGEAAPAAPAVPIVHALSVVQSDATVEKLLRALLGRTYIAPDLTAATAQLQNGHAGCDFVTLTGDLLSRHGVYTGGSLNGAGNSKAPSSILGRKNQIAELQAELAVIQELVAGASRRRGALLSEQTELQASLQQAQTELRQQEVAIATREGEFKALTTSQRLLLQKIDTVAFEIQNLTDQAEEGTQKRNALGVQLEELETRERTGQEKVATLTADLDALRTERDSANAALTENKVSLAAQEQLLASYRQQRITLERRILELGQLVDQRRHDMSSVLTRRESAELEIQESRTQAERLEHERELVSQQTAELMGRQQAQQLDITRREEELRGQRRRLSDIQAQRGGLEIELAQKAMSVQNLCEKIQQKYHVALESVRSECITITLADEGPAKVETLTPEQMAEAGAATDWAAVAEQVETLSKKIEEIGPVNLVAIEEYEETEQRHQFLTQQHDDLVNAKTQLLEIINRINTQTRQMFLDTFEKIRDNFRAMFVDVFGGGKADLVLADASDVLESGIDIVARPPGKQLQGISLLSGGEQTMVAVSLLFSIYQVKPSPFCVLDELDAPLDESNINRFVRVLQRFLNHSQFVIITHNKRTIGMADVLYGVTMEEHGVSKIVSVKFHKAEEAPLTSTATSNAKALEAPAAATPVAAVVEPVAEVVESGEPAPEASAS